MEGKERMGLKVLKEEEEELVVSWASVGNSESSHLEFLGKNKVWHVFFVRRGLFLTRTT